MLFFEQTFNCTPVRSQRIYTTSKRDVFTTVDMTIFTFISECGSTVYYYLTDSSYHQDDIFASTSVSLFMTYLSC